MAPTPKQCDDVLRKLALEQNFHGAIRLSATGGCIFEAAFGLADRGGLGGATLSPQYSSRGAGRKNHVGSAFGIASGTKLLTALAIGRLLDQGTFGRKARFRDLVSADLPLISPEVTIDHLLTHTSGVYDYYDEELIEDFDNFVLPIAPAELLSPADYIPMLAAGDMKFAPGARFSYSNSGYVLLGLVIAEQSGRSFHDFVTDEVLRACDMTDSGFFRFDALPPHASLGYVGKSDGVKTNEGLLPMIGGPDGGAFTTVADFERLWRALMAKKLLSPALTDAFFERANHYKDDTYYGRGVWIEEPGRTPLRWFVEGSDAGVSFESMIFPGDVIATVLSNTSEGAWPIAKAVRDLVAV